jgi:DNA-binding response OmpR family regulator
MGLDLGTGDYLIKPFSARELLAPILANRWRLMASGAILESCDAGLAHGRAHREW